MSGPIARQNALPLLEALMDHVPSGLTVAWAPDATIARVSRFGAELLQRPRNTLESISADKHPEAYRLHRADTGELALADALPLARAVKKGEVVRDEEWLVGTDTGEMIPVLCNAGPINGADGAVIGGVVAWTDLRSQKKTEQQLRDALADRQRLYRESNHRIKNNLQVFASVLRLEAARRGDDCIAFAETIMERLQVIARVHESFCLADRMDQVDLQPFLKTVCEPLASDEHTVTVDVSDGLSLRADQATPVGMIVNEAVCNSLKHAFPGGRPGTVTVHGAAEGDSLCLRISDDGIGWPATQSTGSSSLGVTLMTQLTRQLRGSLTLKSGDAGGAEVTLRIPGIPLTS